MPKMKTKSSAKKRFKVTASGKVVGAQAGKRHGMIKRTNKFLRNARGTTTLSEPDAKIVKRTMMPYAR
ncbi:MAG: 50S ribosomal protein L35 [Pseudomonadota bacterium]